MYFVLDTGTDYPYSPRSRVSYEDEQHRKMGYNGTTNGQHHHQASPPDYHAANHNYKTSPQGRSYHLSDITFSSQLGENTKHLSQNVKTGNVQNIGNHGGAKIVRGQARSVSQQSISSNMGNTAYEKYLKIKNRQRKLRVLRRGLLDEGYEDDDPIMLSEGMDQFDTRSMVSMASVTQGIYHIMKS